MPADFSKPVKTDNYDTGLLSTIRAHITALAMMLDPTDAGTLTNTPTGVRRFNAGTGLLERYNGSSWVTQSTGYLTSAAAASDYAPLGGAGTSGTWGISVTGSAGSVAWSGVSGAPAITGETAATAATASTVAKRDGSGYLFATYFNHSAAVEAPTIGAVFVQNAAADGYLRKVSLANFSAVVAPTWANVSGKPSVAELNTGPVFTGQVRGNSGSKGLGAITVTTTAGTPSGGSDGDLVLVY